MAKRRGFKKNTRRDKYGRYRGSGGIKPWKNNNPDYFKKGQKLSAARRKGRAVSTPQAAAKGMSGKKKVALAVGAVAVAGATAYGIHRYRQSKMQTGPRVGAVPVRPARRQVVALQGRSLRTPMPTTGGGATSVAGRSAPAHVAPARRVTSARVAPSVSTPVTQPQALKVPPAVNARSIVATAGAISAAAALSNTVPDEDRDADYERSVARWKAIEAAQSAGIPAAANFVDSGGNVQAPPTPKRTPFVAPRPSSFVGRPTAVSLTKTPYDYGMRDKGDAFRKNFPQSLLSAKPKANSAPAPTGAVKPSAPTAIPKKVTTQPTKPVNPPTTVKAATAPKKPIQAPKAVTGAKAAPDAAKPKRGRKSQTSPDVLSPDQILMMRTRTAALQEARKNKSVMGNEPQIPIRPSATPMGISKRIDAKPITSGGGTVKPQGKILSSQEYMRLKVNNHADKLYDELEKIQDSGRTLPRDARTFMQQFLDSASDDNANSLGRFRNPNGTTAEQRRAYHLRNLEYRTRQSRRRRGLEP